MVLDKQSLKAMFLGAARVWQENAAHLSEIDSRFGDGDHGVTIGKIAALLEQEAAGWGDASIHDFIEDLAWASWGSMAAAPAPCTAP